MVQGHGGPPPAGTAAHHSRCGDAGAPRPPASASYNLRAVVDYGYSDAFPLLRQGASHEAYFSEAAE